LIHAELHGKLPEIENLEDALTSNVFGLISYLPFQECLLKILEKTKDYTKERNNIINNNKNLNNYTKCKIIFWPQSSEFGEPDIVIIVEDRLLFVVEVKYLSSKSDASKENDQLMRYFKAFSSPENRNTFSSIQDFNGTFEGLIYLTNLEQKNEVEQSITYIEKELPVSSRNRIYELRWKDILNAVQDIKKEEYGKIIADLKDLLEKKNFLEFEGISNMPKDISLNWSNKIAYLSEMISYNGIRELPNYLDFTKGETTIYGR
jgi:hypothetical protein